MHNLLVAGGYPDHHITLVSMDDVASHPANPHPGKLFQSPTSGDVYADCKVHVEKTDVHPNNVANTIAGSFFPDMNEESTLLLYINGNAAPGVLSFRDNEIMFGQRLSDTLHHLRG